MSSKLLAFPISFYFGYTGYVLITEPSIFYKQFDKAVQSLPSVVYPAAQAQLENSNGAKLLGSALILVSVLILLGLKPLLRLVSLVQLALIGAIIAGIVERKLEMQQLSEALERTAYHLVLAGMVLVASSFDNVKPTATKDKKKKVVEPASSEEEQPEKPEKPENKQEQKPEQKKGKKDKKHD